MRSKYLYETTRFIGIGAMYLIAGFVYWMTNAESHLILIWLTGGIGWISMCISRSKKSYIEIGEDKVLFNDSIWLWKEKKEFYFSDFKEVLKLEDSYLILLKKGKRLSINIRRIRKEMRSDFIENMSMIRIEE